MYNSTHLVATAMAPAAATLPTFYCCSEYTQRLRSSTPPISLLAGNPKSNVYGSVSHLGLASASPWSGLKSLGSVYQKSYSRRESKGRCRGRVIYASLFGVGAPEALVIGVVALLVFGPKGLAEVARNLGKTLRAFQPTIRELQEVSREFKSTLEREIGLDEVASPTNNTYRYTSVVNQTPKPIVDPDGSLTTTGPLTSEELLKVTEQQLAAASETGPQAQASNPEEQGQASATITEAVAKSDVAATPAKDPASKEPTSQKEHGQ